MPFIYTPAPFVYAPYTSAESVARRFSFTSRPLLFEKVLTIKSVRFGRISEASLPYQYPVQVHIGIF